MTKTIRALILSALCFPAAAQQPSVVQKLFSVVTGPTASSPVNNIGQTAHTVFLSFTSSNGVSSCSPPQTSAFSAQLEYSFDGQNYSAFGVPNQHTTFAQGSLSAVQIYTGTGVYNYVRFRLITFSGSVGCRASAWYTGSLTPATVLLTGLGSPQATSGQQSLNSNQPNYPVFTCDRVTSLHVTAGNVGTFTVSNQFPVRVCSVVASTAAAAAILQFYEDTIASCTGSSTTLGSKINLTNSGPLTWGNGLGQLFSTSPSFTTLCAGATTADIDVMISYVAGN